MANIKLLPIEEIKRLHYQEELPLYAIAEKFKCNRQTLSRKLQEAGYPVRTGSEALLLAYRRGRKKASRSRERQDISNEEITKLYCDDKLSAVQIAKKFNCSATLIYWRFKKLGIPTRTAGESNRIAWQRQLRSMGKGEKNPNWHGGFYKRDKGYIFKLAPDHPRADRSGYVQEHILVWEETHHRRLPKGHVIHHLNGIKDDNRPSNLVAMKAGEHIHQAAPYKKRIRELEIEKHQLQRALEASQMIFYISEN